MNEASKQGERLSVFSALAAVYPQVYLMPGDEGAEEYRNIVRHGADARVHSLAHFQGSAADALSVELTPAGNVQVVTLGERRDFETLLQIMAYRCVPKQIPKTQGASILDGVINWTKIRAHRSEYLASGGKDWGAEFQRFTSDRRNYTDALILLSVGPYSALPAEQAGLSEEEWLSASQIIRRVHECTHFICRRLYPQKINAVWDELAADAAGLYAAFGRYELPLAARLLGVDQNGYTGGRLENYAERQELDSLARTVYAALCRIEQISREEEIADAYGFALRLEQEDELIKTFKKSVTVRIKKTGPT